MGIALPDTESSSRSNLASATYTAIALVFFFGVGLAGGGAYKIYFGDDGGPQIAELASPPPPASHPAPPQNFAANAPRAAEQAAPDLARIEPSAPPALTPPPAPTVPKQPGLPPPTIVQAAPPPAPPADEPAPQADTAPALPYTDATPLPQDATPEAPAAKPTPVAAIPPKKPEKPVMVAKVHRTTPAQTVALHPPPAAPGNVAGPYRVQFGAFANEDNARRVQWAIEATGLKVDVSQESGPSGHPLYFLRSPAYSDYAAALSAAQTVQHRVDNFVNAIPIDYAILGEHSAVVQQAQR
jgi:sporulation related protein